MSDPIPPSAPQPAPSYTPPAQPYSGSAPQPQYGQFAPPPPAHPPVWIPSAPPLQGIGAATRWLVLASAVMSGITVLVDSIGMTSITASDTGSLPPTALYAYDAISSLISGLSLLVLLAAGICWVVWQYRAAKRILPGALRRSPGWHVGSWFIPVVSLWFPFQNVSDLADASRARLSESTRRLWWGLWIVGNMMSGWASRAVAAADTTSALSSAMTFSILSDLVHIAAAVFAWIVVARITDAIDPAR